MPEGVGIPSALRLLAIVARLTYNREVIEVIFGYIVIFGP